jgi:integrase
MSKPRLQAWMQEKGVWPLERTGYDCSPELTEVELKALSTLVAQLAWKKRTEISSDLQQALFRLLQPLHDIQERLGVYQKYCTPPVQVILRAMYEYSSPYWAWSEKEWTQILQSAFSFFEHLYDLKMYCVARQRLLVMVYLLGPQTDFFWPLLQERSPSSLACKLFGADTLLEAIERIYGVLRLWGYEEDQALKTNMTTTVAWVFLVNRSSRLEDITFTLLSQLYEQTQSYHRKQIERLSRVLAYWGVIESPLTSGNEKKRIPVEQIDTNGIAPEWVTWCLEWYRFSDLAPHVKKAYLYRLFRAGRWLAKSHPDVTIPHQWTAKVAAEYVAAVDEMQTGDFSSAKYREKKLKGMTVQPLGASTKEHLIVALRVFFADLHEEPHNVPRRFDPSRAFRTPRNILKQIGPNPRDLNPLLWAKLVHAALNLTEEDLPRGSTGGLLYPLEFVRAVAAVWVYSGLRMDEIARLELGCIRWQHEDVTVPETGEVLPKEAVCFLTVPVNKTTTAFHKPVNTLVGRRINEWEQVRGSGQPARRDRKTAVLVHTLFTHRGKPMSKHYINLTLIPLLCGRAGIPCEDERGAITSHRARATLATLLYNAPEGLSIFDLMHWLGHKTPQTTQNYARVKPTKLAAAYAKAERNSRLVEVLVDTKADAHGEVKVYYVLGEHGLCGNPDWATCLYRMACIKCPFYVPKDQTQLIEARKTVKRFMEVVELTDEELAAVQDDYVKLEEAVERTQHLSPPTMLRRRAKGAKSRGIPLTVLNTLPVAESGAIS